VVLESERGLLAGALVEVSVAAEDECAAVGMAHLLGDDLDVASAAIISEAPVWRRSWKVSSGLPAWRAAGLKTRA
jgi:hypothetical protein